MKCGIFSRHRNAGGYDSVAFWARSGVMDLMHEADSPSNISRPGYGDSISSLCLLAGIMAALLIRERTGVGQEVEVSLFNTATYALGFDISHCLITGEDAFRPQRKSLGNPTGEQTSICFGRNGLLDAKNQKYFLEIPLAAIIPEIPAPTIPRLFPVPSPATKIPLTFVSKFSSVTKCVSKNLISGAYQLL
jgi:hypothetical protein